MSTDLLFTQALGLCAPWKVISSVFDPLAGSLELVIDFESGSRFPDPHSGELCSVHDTVQRVWQHLHFFQHKTSIRARVPRIKTASGHVRNVEVPWAKPNSGFTLLMEAFLLAMAKVMSVSEVSRQSGVSQDRIWHLVRSRVGEAWKKADWGSLKRLGVDETSTRKGHRYGTAFLEITGQETSRGKGASKVARLLFFTPGKDKSTFVEFGKELLRRGVEPNQIEEIAMDMSPAFIAGAGEHFPQASLCFDRFHVMKLCGQAIDAVRKEVTAKVGSLPRGSLWALRGNVQNLTASQTQLRAQLCRQHKSIARALAIRDYLADTWNYASASDAQEHLSSVILWCAKSRLKPMIQLAHSLRHHQQGILGYFRHYSTSAAIEAVNGLLQLARRKARGYKRFDNFQAIAYWIAGKLPLHPTPNPTH